MDRRVSAGGCPLNLPGSRVGGSGRGRPRRVVPTMRQRWRPTHGIGRGRPMELVSELGVSPREATEGLPYDVFGRGVPSWPPDSAQGAAAIGPRLVSYPFEHRWGGAEILLSRTTARKWGWDEGHSAPVYLLVDHHVASAGHASLTLGMSRGRRWSDRSPTRYRSTSGPADHSIRAGCPGHRGHLRPRGLLGSLERFHGELQSRPGY